MDKLIERESFVTDSQETQDFNTEFEPVFETAKVENEPRLPLIKERVLAISPGGAMGPMSEEDTEKHYKRIVKFKRRNLIKSIGGLFLGLSVVFVPEIIGLSFIGVGFIQLGGMVVFAGSFIKFLLSSEN